MLHDLVARYGPVLVFINALAAALGLPVPAMPTLIVFGALTALHPASLGGTLAPVLVLAIGATLIGDSVWFYAGRLYGGTTLKTLCKLSLSRDTCVRKTERFFGRWGVRVLTVAKLIPGLSLVSVPMAGAMGTSYRTFVTHDSVGAALWAGIGLALGVALSPQIDYLLGIAARFGRASALFAVAFLAVYALWRWARRRALLRALASARIDADTLHALMESGAGPVVFDVRSEETRKLDPFVIPGARFADERELDAIVAAYRPDQKFVIYCSCPNEVTAAWMAKRLIDAGFIDALPLRGGLDAWREAGRPVAPLPVEPAAAPFADAPLSGGDPKIV
jgi:membrane protein DedA with SNARE-associated domain/rhodanese-related sulfurtransferase